ncbi:hypothetical protein [Candidatus Chloroploca asiatica]|uniref:DUF697 domain-containing protein n=1 Tax=Candidatus Chloroploca asiatica TaxID=1506545 RepID=A0A2H3L6R9_9CHLR|nr:hypothetical protein [Candidatus Chloroploca asiatica]PDW00727.1 hypothetical protein A9Q02_08910 [Candidatus Chloroploca asiatica]
MLNWNNFGSAFNTLRELDVTAIREESEVVVRIAGLGSRPLFQRVVEILRMSGSHHFGPHGPDPFSYQPLPYGEPEPGLREADLLLVTVDGRAPLTARDAEAIGRLALLALPTVIIIAGVAAPDETEPVRPEFAHARILVLPELGASDVAEQIATAILDRLPKDRQLAAARAVTGLRSVYARTLVNSISNTNATYVLLSSIPMQIPILSVPIATADMLVLTKNQALMVYRLALAHGAAPDFQARMREILPVVGGAFAWRQLARTLIGLIPFWGILPRVAVSYAGTYATGMAAWRWFAEGELVSRERMKAIAEDALRIGREQGAVLIATMRAQGNKPGLSLFRRRHKE